MATGMGDNIEQIAMLSGGTISPFACAASEPNVKASPGIACEPACNFDPCSGVIGAQF
jgi:hypothetical protein